MRPSTNIVDSPDNLEDHVLENNEIKELRFSYSDTKNISYTQIVG